MRILVADEDSGSIKEITFPLNTNTSDKTAPQPTSSLIYAKEGFKRHIQAFAQVGKNKQWAIAARKDGSVCLYDISEPAKRDPLEVEETNGDNKSTDKTTKAAKKDEKSKPVFVSKAGDDGRFPLIYQWPAYTAINPLPENAPKHARGDSIVGLVEEYPGGIVMTLSKEGKLVAYDLIAASMSGNAKEGEESKDDAIFSSKTVLGTEKLPGSDYTCIAVHSSQPGIIAVGGNEVELQVYGADWETEEGEEEPKSRLTPLWKPKNVKRDELGLKVPVWIHSIFFLEDKSNTEPISTAWSYLDEDDEEEKKKKFTFTTKIATVIHHGEVRIYDPEKNLRPITRLRLLEKENEFLSTAGVAKLHFNQPQDSEKKDDNEEEEDIYSTTPVSLLVTDRKTSTYVVTIEDNTKLKMTGKLHGATGSIGALTQFAQPQKSKGEAATCTNASPQYVATGSLDRFVRVYKPDTRQQVSKIYVGTKPTGIIVLDGFEHEGGYDGETEEKLKRQREEAEDDLLWNKLDKAEGEEEEGESEDEPIEEDEEPAPQPKKKQKTR